MRRWILVTKEKDYESEKDSDWRDLDDADEIHYIINHNIHKGDKVIVYRSGQWTKFSHIFEVKDCSYQAKGEYLMQLHQKKEIPEGIGLAELKNEGIIKDHRKFRRRIYKVPLCCWSEIVGLIKKKNPDFLNPPNMSCFKGPYKGGCPTDNKKEFLDTLNTVKYINLNANEEETKYRLILPLLESIGFAINNTNRVHPEYPINEKFADYILTDYDTNKICIEAKKPSMDLTSERCRQLRWNCASENINIGILTNGIKWRFYKLYFHDAELGALQDMKFEEIDISEDSTEDVFNIFLKYFWNGKLSANKPKKFVRNNESIINQVKYISVLNESEVKQAIVLPILKNLGWDLMEKRELFFNPHTEIKVIKNNKRIKKKIRPDYALKGRFKICIEVKGIGIKGLDDHAGHVKTFCEKKKFDIGVATDGRIWDFIIFKNHQYHDEKKLDLKTDSMEKCLTYFRRYLSPN